MSRIDSIFWTSQLFFTFVATIAFINIKSVVAFKSIWKCSNFKPTSKINMSAQPFNPFTTRHKNSNIKWFEADLEAFYSFVEIQPLLTREEELRYGKALQMHAQVQKMRKRFSVDLNNLIADDELSKILGCSSITLAKISRCADVSKTRLVECNLKLVLAVVSRYRTSSIPNTELIAEGTRGLSKAVLRYDHSKGFRFATYATWYVHQAIADYVRWRKHPAKMPTRYLVLWRRIKDFATSHRTTTNRMPSVSEISNALDVPSYDVKKVLEMQTSPTSLSDPVGRPGQNTRGEDNSRILEDVLPSLYKEPWELSDNRDLRLSMETLLQTNLNEVERDVLRLRLGLDDGNEKAVKEVGKRFKISWKQVRSLEKEALSKLSRSEGISEFVNSCNSV